MTYYGQDAASGGGQAGDEDGPEIEVTPAMIIAGVGEMVGLDPGWNDHEIAAKVFREMVRARDSEQRKNENDESWQSAHMTI